MAGEIYIFKFHGPTNSPNSQFGDEIPVWFAEKIAIFECFRLFKCFRPFAIRGIFQKVTPEERELTGFYRTYVAVYIYGSLNEYIQDYVSSRQRTRSNGFWRNMFIGESVVWGTENFDAMQATFESEERSQKSEFKTTFHFGFDSSDNQIRCAVCRVRETDRSIPKSVLSAWMSIISSCSPKSFAFIASELWCGRLVIEPL